jgi:hypothetical protein
VVTRNRHSGHNQWINRFPTGQKTKVFCGAAGRAAAAGSPAGIAVKNAGRSFLLKADCISRKKMTTIITVTAYLVEIADEQRKTDNMNVSSVPGFRIRKVHDSRLPSGKRGTAYQTCRAIQSAARREKKQKAKDPPP